MISAVKIIFWVVIPAIIIYLRTKKKFKTGFAIGFVLTSMLLGILVSASLTPSPFASFIRNMNNNNFEEAERNFRVILQKDPDDVRFIDRSEIINQVKYDRMRDKLYKEYITIAEDNISSTPVPETENCRDIVKVEKAISDMVHSMRVVKMAEALGPERVDLKKRIAERKEKIAEKLEALDAKCR